MLLEVLVHAASAYLLFHYFHQFSPPIQKTLSCPCSVNTFPHGPTLAVPIISGIYQQPSIVVLLLCCLLLSLLYGHFHPISLPAAILFLDETLENELAVHKTVMIPH